MERLLDYLEYEKMLDIETISGKEWKPEEHEELKCLVNRLTELENAIKVIKEYENGTLYCSNFDYETIKERLGK